MGVSMTRVPQLLAAAAIVAVGASAPAAAQTPNRQQIERIVAERHDATVQALRDWIALPTIAAERPVRTGARRKGRWRPSSSRSTPIVVRLEREHRRLSVSLCSSLARPGEADPERLAYSSVSSRCSPKALKIGTH